MKPTIAALLVLPLTAMLVAAGTAHPNKPDLQRTGQA
jgi:hypothetical protein